METYIITDIEGNKLKNTGRFTDKEEANDFVTWFKELINGDIYLEVRTIEPGQVKH